jgi:autotransporter-associated beta strand protein
VKSPVAEIVYRLETSLRRPRSARLASALVAALLLAGAAGLNAAVSTWNSASGNWSVAGNWLGNAVPASGNDVLIENNGLVQLTDSRTVGSIWLDTPGAIGTAAVLTIGSSGVLSATNLQVGASAGRSGTVTVAGGTLNVTSDYRIGLSGTGVVNLSSGAINANNFHLGSNASASGTLNITGGTFTAPGNTQIQLGASGTGVLTMSAGTLSAGTVYAAAFSTGSGAMTFSGGTAAFTGINVSGAGAADILVNGGQVTAGAVSIDTYNDTRRSSLTVSSGSLTVDSLTLADKNSITLTGAGALNFTNPSTKTLWIGAGAQDAAVYIGTGGAAGTLDVGTLDTNLGTGLVVFNHTGTVAFAPVIQGAIKVIKTGAGTTSLSGTNNYSRGTDINAGTLSFTGNAALGYGDITFNGGTLLYAAGNTADISLSRTVALASGTSTIDIGANNVSFALPFGNAGSGTFTKAGSGILTLAGSNYTGATTVSAGTLRAGGDSAFSASSTYTILSGATLDSAGQSPAIGALAGTAGAVTLGGGTLTLGGNDTSTTFGGVISGAGGIVKTGSGTFTLTAENTYTGGTTVSAGRLVAAHNGENGTFKGSSTVTVNAGGILQVNLSDALGWGNGNAKLVVNGGTVTTDGSAGEHTSLQDVTMTAGRLTDAGGNGQYFLNGPLVTNASASSAVIDSWRLELGNGWTPGTTSLTVADGAAVIDLDIASEVMGAGPLVKKGAGLLRLTGTNTYIGGTTLNGGTLLLGSAGALGVSGAIAFTGGTLQYSASNATDYSARFSNAASQAYRIDTNGRDVTFAAALASAGGTLAKLGPGTLTLTGANSFNGVTTISAGTLQIGAGGGSGAISGDIVNDGALVFDRTGTLSQSGVISGSGPLTKRGAGTVTLGGANTYTGATTVSAGVLVLSGSSSSPAFTVASGATLDFDTSAGSRDALVSATFAGAGTFRKSGGNTLSWSAQPATFALAADSLIDVEGGTFEAANTNWAGNLSSLHVASGATFAGEGAAVRVDVLTGAGTITAHFDGSNKVVTFGVNNGSGTFAGTLADSDTAIGQFVKVGTGTQELTGISTFGGGLVIQGGTVLANNNPLDGSATGDGGVYILAGTLGGAGRVGGVSLQGNLSPGAAANSIGTLHTDGMSWWEGGTYVWQIQDANGPAGSGYDFLSLDGVENPELYIDGTPSSRVRIAVQSLTFSSVAGLASGLTPGATYHWTIASVSGTITNFDPASFEIDTAGFFNDPNTAGFTISQVGNDLILNYTAVPEPTTYAIGIVALLGGAVLLRRRGFSRK